MRQFFKDANLGCIRDLRLPTYSPSQIAQMDVLLTFILTNGWSSGLEFVLSKLDHDEVMNLNTPIQT